MQLNSADWSGFDRNSNRIPCFIAIQEKIKHKTVIPKTKMNVHIRT